MPPTQNQLQLADPPHGALMSQPGVEAAFFSEDWGLMTWTVQNQGTRTGVAAYPMVFVVFSKDFWGL